MTRWIAFCLLLGSGRQDASVSRAGFAEIDISPPPGTRKIGWNNKNFGTSVLDPLYAKVAVFEAGSRRAGFIGLDLLFIHREEVAQIRQRIQERFGVPGEAVLIGATHNHAGPAIEADLYPRDEAYVRDLVDKVVQVFGRAWESREEAQIGQASESEGSVGYNRRVLYRDGTVHCHGSFKDENALALEGPIDPEVAVLAARAKDGRTLGTIVNFACHPCHHGGDQVFSAGYPGRLAQEMREKGCPVTIFLQGAGGNIHHRDPLLGQEKSMEEIGRVLAQDVGRAMAKMKWAALGTIAARSRTVELPYRPYTDEDLRGTAKGAQRFGEPGFYDKTMPLVLDEIKREGRAKAEVQAIWLGDVAYVAVPAEYFVQLGLRIKEETHPCRTRVVGYANGMVGYVPHREAFPRGGYEATFGLRSKLGPEAGDLLAESAIQLVRTR